MNNTPKTIGTNRPLSLTRTTCLCAAMLLMVGCLNTNPSWLVADPEAVGRAVEGDDTLSRPAPDSRGIISYKNYSVVVGSTSETMAEVAARVGWPVETLARYNGIRPDTRFTKDQVIVLPGAEDQFRWASTNLTGAEEFTTMASRAIDRADVVPSDFSVSSAPLGALPEVPAVAAGPEPIRHRVARGETAFSIARLYDVPVDRLAEWNNLSSDLNVREEQIVLIPATLSSPGGSTQPIPLPGNRSFVSAPPSAASPLPLSNPQPAALAPLNSQIPNNSAVGAVASSNPSAQMSYPVRGAIIREFDRGRNEGIDISAPAGTPVVAAASGVVAAISEDTKGIKILVLRHQNSLLSVYTNIDNINVAKNQQVLRDQPIAQVQAGTPSFVHFEVREGLTSVDPLTYLE